jgi:putative Mg2+ transporter-C (MgtC) family protein
MVLEGIPTGYEYYFLAAVATAFAVGVPRIPHISKLVKKDEET